MANKFLKTVDAFAKNNVMTCQITTRECLEKFSLWDNQDKKFLQENTKVFIESGEKEVNKYIKLSDKDKERYTRKPQFVREVVFNGEKFSFGFNKTTEDLIKQQIETLDNLGNDFIMMDFVITRTPGFTPLDMKYSVSVKKRGVALPKPEFNLDDEDEVIVVDSLTPEESSVLESIETKYPDYRNQSPAVWADAVVRKIKISPQRALSIVEKHLFQ